MDIYKRHNIRPYIGILPGIDWLYKHEHDLDGWQPTIGFSSNGVKYHMTIRNPKIIKDIVKVIK